MDPVILAAADVPDRLARVEEELGRVEEALAVMLADTGPPLPAVLRLAAVACRYEKRLDKLCNSHVIVRPAVAAPADQPGR